MHVRAFAAVRPLQDITVYSPTPERRVEFAETMSAELGVPCHVVESAEHASKAFRETADVVLAAARSYGEKPILFAEDLKPGATVVSIGSTVPHQREIDVSVVECCDLVVCDEVGEVIEQTGDMRAATEEGLAVQDKCASLHSLMTGAADDALAKSQIRMFKSVGSGLQDVVIAGVALDRAIEAGTAQSLPITFST
jgi:ornithine cyclodeaminase/alanine dehydrogenase